jgi:hypothetical protein
MGMKILQLTLKKPPFEVMVTGEKHFEIREKSRWMTMRLYDKDGYQKTYDLIKFVNGYGKNRPYFIAKYLDFCTIYCMDEAFSNGLKLKFNDEKWIIYFGEIIEIGNLEGALNHG